MALKISNPTKPNCPRCYPDKDFCPECGEKKFDPTNLLLRNFLKDFFNEFTDVDSKFLRTLYFLSFKPGFLSEEYSKGIHVHYIKPLRLFLIIGVIHFLAFGLSRSADLYRIDGTLSILSQFEKIKEWAWLKPHLSTSFDVVQVNQSIKDILSVLIYFILFVISGIYFQFFKKRRAYYSEHLVLFLHIISAAFLRNFVLLPVLMYNIVLGIALLTFINLVYVVLALKRFYGLSPAHAVLIIFPTMLVVGSLMLFFWVMASVVTLWRY